jgi:hypothetical protein
MKNDKASQLELMLTEVYEDELDKQSKTLEDTVRSSVSRALDELIRRVVGLEWDSWERVWTVPKTEYEIDRNSRLSSLRDKAATAADAVISTITFEDITLTRSEIERIRKVYRSAYIASVIEAAKEAAERQARATVSKVMGIKISEIEEEEQADYYPTDDEL